jgi:hypothetical protein
MPYKRFPRVTWTFSTSDFSWFLEETDFFNSHGRRHQLESERKRPAHRAGSCLRANQIRKIILAQGCAPGGAHELVYASNSVADGRVSRWRLARY